MNGPKYHIIQFACILTVLGIIMLQGFTHIVKLKPLASFEPSISWNIKPTFKNCYDGTYQRFMADKAKKQTGFGEFFSRVYNQMAYSCFGRTCSFHIIEGYDHELFLKRDLEEVMGKTLNNHYSNIEEAKVEAKKNVEATLTLIDTLRRHGTAFLFVFAPSKPAVYPEKIPTSYRNQIADFLLEDYYIELFKENDIPHIDFLNNFRSIKDSYPYPLYTRTGGHWANSTIPFVADSILRKIESLTSFELPSVYCSNLNISTNYSGADGELEDNMNLLFSYPKPAVPDPVFSLTDTESKDRPNLLVVGDGYFSLLEHSCFTEAFNQWDFWLYNRESYSSRPAYNGKQLHWILDAAEVIEDADLVLAVFTSAYLYQYMGGFTQSAQELLQNGRTTDQEAIALIIQSIKGTPEWYQAIEQQAKDRGISVEENLNINAEYVLQAIKQQNKRTN